MYFIIHTKLTQSNNQITPQFREEKKIDEETATLIDLQMRYVQALTISERCYGLHALY